MYPLPPRKTETANPPKLTLVQHYGFEIEQSKNRKFQKLRLPSHKGHCISHIFDCNAQKSNKFMNVFIY